MNTELEKIFAERADIDRQIVANATVRGLIAGDLAQLTLERSELERRRAELVSRAHEIDQHEKAQRRGGK